MDEKPGYYSILPAKVRYDNSLKPMEKIMFSEISALSNVSGYCHAGNAYFANLYDKSKPTISVWINDLKKNNHIRIEYEHDGKQIVGRKIYPKMDNTSESKEGYLEKSKEGYLEKSKEGYLEKSKNPISKNLKENITSINNTRVNTSLSISPHGELSKKEERKTKTTKSKLEKSLDKWSEQIDSDVAQYGYELAKENAASKSSELSYFNAIMRDWQDKGLSSVAEVKDYLNIKRNNSSNKQDIRPDVTIPDWMNEKYDPEKDKLSPKKKAEMDRIMAKLKEGSSA